MLWTLHRTRALLAASFLGFVGWLAPGTALAVGNEGEPDAIGKGIVGGALLGAELTVTVEAIVGVRPWWGYLLGGGLGAVAGGVGGYFVADAAGPEVPTAFLVSSLVLAVPTTVFVLSRTSYNPSDEERIAQGPDPRSNVVTQEVANIPSLFETRAQGTLGLNFPQVNVGQGRIEGIPAPSASRSFTAPQGTFVQIPLLNLRFH